MPYNQLTCIGSICPECGIIIGDITNSTPEILCILDSIQLKCCDTNCPKISKYAFIGHVQVCQFTTYYWQLALKHQQDQAGQRDPFSMHHKLHRTSKLLLWKNYRALCCNQRQHQHWLIIFLFFSFHFFMLQVNQERDYVMKTSGREIPANVRKFKNNHETLVENKYGQGQLV